MYLINLKSVNIAHFWHLWLWDNFHTAFFMRCLKNLICSHACFQSWITLPDNSHTPVLSAIDQELALDIFWGYRGCWVGKEVRQSGTLCPSVCLGQIMNWTCLRKLFFRKEKLCAVSSRKRLSSIREFLNCLEISNHKDAGAFASMFMEL